MRVWFEAEGAEQEGTVRDFTTMGTFVLCEGCSQRGEIKLHFDSGADQVSVAGEVVRVTKEGFAVAFGFVPPSTLTQLAHLAHPDQAGTAPSKVQDPAPAPKTRTMVSIHRDEWQPPVSEPVLHEWKPEGDLMPPPASNEAEPGWENLPTLSPGATKAPIPEAPIPEAPIPEAPIQETPIPGVPIPEASASIQEKSEPWPDALEIAPAAAAQPAAIEVPDSESFDLEIVTNSEPTPMEPEPEPEPPAEEFEITEIALPLDTDPKPEDRRQSARTDTAIPLSFDSLTSLIKEYTHNISYGGLFVFTSKALEKDDTVAVTLIHPVHGDRLTLAAQVAHASLAPSPDPITGQSRFGVGVQFLMPIELLKQRLSDFISSHQKPKAITELDQSLAEAQQLLTRAAESSEAVLQDNGTSPEKVRRTYFALVDRFHPDRFFGKVEANQQKMLENLFRQLTAAYEKLTS